MSIPITVNEIGEFVRYKSCERRIRLAINGDTEAKRLPFYGKLFNTIDPVLRSVGQKREQEWERSLLDEGYTKLANDLVGLESLAQFFQQLAVCQRKENYFGREIGISGTIGGFQVNGNIDFLLLQWKGSFPILRIVECKTSRKEKTYHRIQIALFQKLLQDFLRSKVIRVDGIQLGPTHIESVVARIDKKTHQSEDIPSLEPLRLDREIADIEKLLEERGNLSQILSTPLESLDYCIESKCDDCRFNVHCLTESSRLNKIQLIGLSATTLKVLSQYGVESLDDLAELDLNGETAKAIRNHTGFSENLGFLVKKAQARRATLPQQAEEQEKGFEVISLRYDQQTTLPSYSVQGHPLIRIYLSVDYDNIENRIIALSAHITKSLYPIRTRFEEADVMEEVSSQMGHVDLQDIQGKSIIEIIPAAWTGVYAEDNEVERMLLQSFFKKLGNMISQVAGTYMAPIHFYVWSRSEIRNLTEACGRLGTSLLASFQHLLGCRESLDQLIFSCLEDEVKHNYGLGWTGRGLPVIASLTWFGKRYSWRRKIEGKIINLENLFYQDIFDFKAELDLTETNEWGKTRGTRHKFEIRSRYRGGLTVPYFHAYWGSLPADAVNPQVQEALDRYQKASYPPYLSAFLEARTHALRWIEGFLRKNTEIQKPFIQVRELHRFSLDVHETRKAAINYLQLDYHVKYNDWLANNLRAPINRISTGEALPLKDIQVVNDKQVTCLIDVERIGISLSQLSAISNIQEDSFARLSPCDPSWEKGQSLKQLLNSGASCTVDHINWETGLMVLSIMFARPSTYIVKSFGIGRLQPGTLIFQSAILDSSISDYVSNRVARVLEETPATHINEWFHPSDPKVPPSDSYTTDQLQVMRELVEGFRYGGDQQYALHPGQVQAIMDGLRTRVQLLLGPPGTGKTMTTAVSVLCKILLKHEKGDILLISGNTHRAVDELLLRIRGIVEDFTQYVGTRGYSLPPIFIGKASRDDSEVPPGIAPLPNYQSTPIKDARREHIVIIGGTISSILKLGKKLDNSAGFQKTGFNVKTMIIDEASMMVFPNFLALATLVSPEGEIMLAGDHHQLSPIVAHDWNKEDRPTVILYQPFLSSYDSMRRLKKHPHVNDRAIHISPLTYTYRLPQVVRSLIAQLYRTDHFELGGRTDTHPLPNFHLSSGWESVWQGYTGLFLVVHDERSSRKSNPVEIDIVERILLAYSGAHNNKPIPQDHIALVTPHRTQRTLLKQRFEKRYKDSITVIDTVERLQGGERPTIIVSATASDPSAISATAEFVLNLNRANVAFSRSSERLIVVVSQSLLNFIPSDAEHYDNALLWKTLRKLCGKQISVAEIEDGYKVEIFTVGK
ncbi:MAG: AAA domain-containing protein [Bacteroidota bacterium]